jgi:copper homeostasis protein
MSATPARQLEVIVLSVDDAVRAEDGGATRVEVVRDIHEDGLTPAVALVDGLLARVRIPLRVMVRPRNTFLVGDRAHRDEIEADARRFADHPVDVVTGYVRPAADGSSELDEEALQLVARHVPKSRITVHRAVERLTADPANVLHRCSAVDRVLSGGGAGTWTERTARLVDLQARIAPVQVIVGGGVTSESVPVLAAESTLRELHVGRLARVRASFTEPVDPAVVAALRQQWSDG